MYVNSDLTGGEMAQFNRLYISELNRGGLIEYSIERNADMRQPIVKINYRMLSTHNTEDVRDEFSQTISQLLNCIVKENYHGDMQDLLYLIPIADQDDTSEWIMA
jgi:hypothetical protein